MKQIYIVVAVFSLYFLGCSPVYILNDFRSKDKFYEDFNKSVADKNVNVILTNDSSFNIINAEIVNDTLYSVKYATINQYRRIALAEINNINYLTNDYKSGELLLKNNETLQAEGIKIFSDSVGFTEIKRLMTRENISNITKVKNVVYNKHWPGIIPGIICGFLGSFIIAGLGESSSTNSDSGFFSSGAAMFIGVPIGTLLGAGIGWYIGYDCTYHFNR
jgi:hypothetical protein